MTASEQILMLAEAARGNRAERAPLRLDVRQACA